MGFEDLIASQPTGDSLPDESVMVNEDSSAPLNNADGLDEAASTASANVDGEDMGSDPAIKAMQKRIDKITGKSKELEEQLIRERAEREALEKLQNQSQPKTLADLDTQGLSNFIAKAESDPELEQYLPEARLELQRKLVQEELGSFKQELTQKQVQEQGEVLTNNIINNLSGGKLADQDSVYYHTAANYLSELQSDQYKGIDTEQVLAVALAENEYLKSQPKGETMSAEQRVIKNRNNNIQSNNRVVSGNGADDLASLLKESGSLNRSNQAGQGNFRKVLKSLDVMKGFE